MARQTPEKRRRRRPRHDQGLIAELLAERLCTGESYASLSERSGIPAATLAWHAGRDRDRSGKSGSEAFVELVPQARLDPESEPVRDADLRVVVRSPEGVREVVVPPGFDSSELLRLIAILEAGC